MLQVDDYGGYKALTDRGGIQLAFCWAHVRRRFYELAQGGPTPTATQALERIARLYRIRGGDPRPLDRGAAGRSARSTAAR